jgi:hypothetical protein
MGESMNFKKLTLLFLGLFSVLSVHSFGSFFDKNSQLENGDEPIFIYKLPLGIKRTYSRKEVEKWMSPIAWIARPPILVMNISGVIILTFMPLPLQDS